VPEYLSRMFAARVKHVPIFNNNKSKSVVANLAYAVVHSRPSKNAALLLLI